MTTPKHDMSAFRDLLTSGQVHSSRRDLIRASAIAAAAAAMPLRGVVAQDPGTPTDLTNVDQNAVVLGLPLNTYGQVLSVDPHRTVNWGPYWVFMPYAWSGLLRFDENGAVEADLAESVTPNEDGSVWTATLREGIAFANGDPIVAADVVASWMRALDATQLTPMARFFSPIEGADEIASGENVVLGATAVDDRTIEIRLTAPLAYFPSYLATFGYAIMHPRYNAAEDGVDLAGAASGPWQIAEVTDTLVRMVPNTHHWSESAAAISEIAWHVAPGGNTDATLIDWFLDEQIAVADAPLSVIDRVQEDSTLASLLRKPELSSSTLMLALDFHQAPFNDVRVRSAIATSIDRSAWATEIQKDTYAPASSFSPNVLSTIANYEAPTDAYDDDPASLLQAAEIDPETTDGEILLFQAATESMESMDRTAALVSMIQDATGLTITYDTALTAEQITAARQDGGGLQMTLMQLQLDTDQPSLLAIASQESEYNAGWFNWEPTLEPSGDYTPGDDAAAFDELVSTAAATLDEAERNALYAEAEALLLKNAVLIPVGFWTPQYLQKPWLTGTRQGPWTGSTPLRIDAEVSIDQASFPGTPAPAI